MIAGSGRNDRLLLPAQMRDRRFAQIEMTAHELRWGERHPLVERKVGVIAALEHFEEAERDVAGVFDIVAHGEGYLSDNAGLLIERPRGARRREHAHPALSLDLVLPLIRIGVPMHVSHPAGSDLDQR